MKLTVIVTKEGRVAGATATGPSPESRVGHPSARLVAGPGQQLIELDVPDQLVPPPEADAERLGRFFAELKTRIGTARPR
jgi:hypothetical protein